jgi:hypothetical protein
MCCIGGSVSGLGLLLHDAMRGPMSQDEPTRQAASDTFLPRGTRYEASACKAANVVAPSKVVFITAPRLPPP